jgi:glycerol-1-phosphate dehydrogenase [NAD(P)+]
MPSQTTPTSRRDALRRALESASDTRALEIGRGALHQVPAVFASQFGTRPAVIVADANTFPAAGHAVFDAFRAEAAPLAEPFIFINVLAEYSFVVLLQDKLAKVDAIPIAVGSGTINDLTKLVAHRLGRPYMTVATAASMDGYTAFGSSITYKGSKQTFDCPAPRAVVADLDVIAAAPPALNASGYADLLAKVTAGADWIAADALGEEPIDAVAWELVQSSLRRWTSNPAGIPRGEESAIAGLVEGLMMGGFAMQRTKTSRPASGAEHQFSHLWDMQHQARHASHGFKVGIGTLAVTRLYEHLLSLDLSAIDPDQISCEWPKWPEQESSIRRLYDIPELAEKGVLESKAKYVPPDRLRSHLETLRQQWPALRDRLREQLIPSQELSQMLHDAGAPTTAEQIGISPARLRDSHRQAYHIRRRYTVLDLAVRAGVLAGALDHLYPAG